MPKQIAKITVLLVCFLTLLTTASCSEDNCSGIANSIPPYENIILQFIDQENKEVVLEASAIEINSADKKEKIDYGTTFFRGFSISKRNPITSNTIEISYKKEKIAVLAYTKKEVKTECNGKLYLLERRSMRSLSKNYLVDKHNEDAITEPIRIQVLP